MERLTERRHIYHACEFMDSGLEKPFNKLAEYEDTGLNSEEITSLKLECEYWELEAKKYCAQIGEIKIDTAQARCDRCKHEDTDCCLTEINKKLQQERDNAVKLYENMKYRLLHMFE